MINGFVDLQINGYMGVDFSSNKLDRESCITAFQGIIDSGTLLFLPTIITSNLNIYDKNIQIISDLISTEPFKKHIPGIHLEGPFFSRCDALGAHNPDFTHTVSIKVLDKFVDLSNGKIKLLTLGADVEGVDDLIKYAVNLGIKVSLGHHVALADQVTQAADAGATAFTHLGNGLPALINRHDNPLLGGLAEDRLKAMIITDGHHLPIHLIKLIIKVKGLNNIIIVSDAAPLAGMPPGKYETLGNKVILTDKGRLYSPDKGCLIGSSAMMIDCINYLYANKILSYEELIQVGYSNPLDYIDYKIEELPSEKLISFDKENGFKKMGCQ
ncbi:MAG TPA: hypothetical protein QF753_13300 [Victivallales bacterium]|nr:hypothetical protein [Victivallales bacterium]